MKCGSLYPSNNHISNKERSERIQYLVQRDKGKNLRQNTRTAARQVMRQPVGEAVVVEGRPFRRPCDRRDPDTKHSLFFVSTSREGRAGPLSSLSDKPASPSDCDFWQRVDPFDSGYHWGPKFKEKNKQNISRNSLVKGMPTVKL